MFTNVSRPGLIDWVFEKQNNVGVSELLTWSTICTINIVAV